VQIYKKTVQSFKNHTRGRGKQRRGSKVRGEKGQKRRIVPRITERGGVSKSKLGAKSCYLWENGRGALTTYKGGANKKGRKRGVLASDLGHGGKGNKPNLDEKRRKKAVAGRERGFCSRIGGQLEIKKKWIKTRRRERCAQKRGVWREKKRELSPAKNRGTKRRKAYSVTEKTRWGVFVRSNFNLLGERGKRRHLRNPDGGSEGFAENKRGGGQTTSLTLKKKKKPGGKKKSRVITERALYRDKKSRRPRLKTGEGERRKEHL